MTTHNYSSPITTTNTYASAVKVTITESEQEKAQSKLMSRHDMGTMITRLTNRVNQLEDKIERVTQLADDFDPSPMSDAIREALKDSD